MFAHSASRARIAAALDRLLDSVNEEIRQLSQLTGIGTQTRSGAEIADLVTYGMDCAVLRERTQQLRAGWKDRDLPEIKRPEQTPPNVAAPLISEVHRNEAGIPKFALSRAEAAKALGVSPATIDRLVVRKLLRPSLATRRQLFAPTELERFMRETAQTIEA